jgi:hypothetical protein
MSKIQQIPVRLEGTIEVILDDDSDTGETFDFLFDVLPGRTVHIVTDAFDFDFDIAGLGLTVGRKVIIKEGS